MCSKKSSKDVMFLLVTLTVLSLIVVGCVAPTPEVIEKEVVVEKLVVETVVVEKEVVVEKLVVETVVVEPTPAEKITLKLWSGTAEMHNFYGIATARYTQLHPNVTFELSVLPQRTLDEKLAVALPAGEAADLLLGGGAMSYLYYQQGYLAPLSEEMQAYLRSMGLPRTIVENEITAEDGNIFVAPMYMDTGVYFYNKDYWEEAGITRCPETLDELMEWGRKLTKYDEAGNVVRPGLDLRLSGGGRGVADKFWSSVSASMGCRPVEKVDGGYRCGLDNDCGRATLKFYIDAVHKYKVDSMDAKSDAEAFGLGLTAMFYRESWVVHYLDSNAPDLNYGACPLPAGPGGKGGVPGAAGLVIANTCEHTDVAEDFIKFVYDEMMVDLFKIGFMPARLNLDYSEIYDEWPVLKVFVGQLGDPEFHGYSYELIEPSAEIFSRMADRLMSAYLEADLVDNPAGIAAVMHEICEEINSVLDEYDLLAK